MIFVLHKKHFISECDFIHLITIIRRRMRFNRKTKVLGGTGGLCGVGTYMCGRNVCIYYIIYDVKTYSV